MIIKTTIIKMKIIKQSSNNIKQIFSATYIYKYYKVFTIGYLNGDNYHNNKRIET